MLSAHNAVTVNYQISGSATADVIGAAVLSSTGTLANNLASPAAGSGKESYPGAEPQAASTTKAPTPKATAATASSAQVVQSSLILTTSIVAVALFL
jgi:hypothetical protein